VNSSRVKYWMLARSLVLLHANLLSLALLNTAFAQAPLQISTVAFPPATTGVPYSVSLSATGGTPPYRWSVSSGSLPPGLSLDDGTGGISGIPSTSNAPTVPVNGTFQPFPLIFQVQDSQGSTATANLPIEAADPITIQPSSLPSGSAGVPYSVCLNAVGGALAYAGGAVWNVAGGALPPGIALTHGQLCLGLIAGTPTQSGQFPVQIQVGDFEGRTAQASYVLSISGGSSTSLLLTLTPPSLGFTAVAGGSAPASQTSQVSVNGGSLGFTATVTAGASWLSVSPAGSTTPAILTVAANPAGLSPGPYNGQIQITASGAANNPQYLGVTLTVADPTPAISSVLSGASLQTGAVAPGSIVTIKGKALGPDSGVSMQPDSKGNYGTNLAGSQVLINGVAAPMLYAQSSQVNAIVPFESNGASSIAVQATYNNMTSASSTVPMQQAAPALFTASSTGTGQGAILNQDNSVNSSGNPAHPGTIVALYGTGGGLFQTSLGDGTTAGATSLKLPVTAQVGGADAQVVYAGSAPGLVAGGFQINVTIPPGTAAGNVPVVVFVNGVASQPGVTVAVR
jgi:uncharacterized protein (TIGR03437 family)